MSQYDVDKFFNLAIDMCCIAGEDGFFKRVNPAFTRILGWSEKELYSKSFLNFVHPDDIESTKREIESLSQGKETIDFENRYLCADGAYKLLSWKTAPESTTKLLYAIARDITAERLNQNKTKKLTSELQEAQALIEVDPLTGLLNRRALNMRLEKQIQLMQRIKCPISILMVDIDNFKELNAKHGHQGGDDAIKTVAKYLLEKTRSTDLVLRYGGDEFLIALPNTTIQDACILADNICTSIYSKTNKEIPVTVSIGVSNIDFKEEKNSSLNDKFELIKEADQALYLAKRSGKNQVKQFSSSTL